MPLDSTDAPSTATPLYWLHGFTQTGASAHRFRSILAGQRPVVGPDLPGHGSQRHHARTLEETADDIAATLPVDPVIVGGYSLGGRVALHLALRHPEKLRALILVGATRGLPTPNAREARRQRDETLARHIEDVGADAFIDEWLAQPMFARLPVDEAERRARQANDAAGLASSLRLSGTGTQRWLGEDIPSLPMPILAIAGAADDRFATEALALAHDAPRGEASLVPGAGHAAHLQQPALTAALVAAFCARYG